MSEEIIVIKKEEETVTIPQSVASTETDYEAKIAQLEVEKLNYKTAFLKEKSKNKEEIANESEDEKIQRIVDEKIAATKLAEFDSQKEELLKKALKENKELKLAQLNKPNTPPAGIGSHNETIPVSDTLITPEQLAALKARGFNDKDIERYKKNFIRYSGR